jgi:Domain of unknown function (DUF4190)
MNQPPLTIDSSAVPKTSALAISSLILGILSLTCFFIFSGIPAVICGHLAYSRIGRSGGALEGKGLALGGLITGYLGIALSIFVIPLMLAIAIPNFVKARQTAQAHLCINNLQRIDTAVQLWALQTKKEKGAIPSESELVPFLGGTFPVCPAGGVYRINPVEEKPSCSIPGHELR